MGLCSGDARLLHLAAVIRASLRIFLWVDIDCNLVATIPLCMHPLQKRNAPVTPCAGTLAQRQFARNTGAFTLEKSGEFPQADPETQADMIVRLHRPSLGRGAQLQSLHAPIRNAQGTNNMAIAIPAVVAFMLRRECKPRIHDADKSEDACTIGGRH